METAPMQFKTSSMVMQSTRTFNNSVKTVNNKSTVSISSGLQDDQSDYKQMQANQMIKSRNKLNGSRYNNKEHKYNTVASYNECNMIKSGDA